MINSLNRHFKRAVENILGNSRLTADLDDETAQVLMAWGIAQAKEIVSASTGPTDGALDASLEERLQANQKMMRLINNWISGRFKRETEENHALLEQIIAKAAQVYDRGFGTKSESQRARFIHEHLETDQPDVLISELRTFLEN